MTLVFCDGFDDGATTQKWSHSTGGTIVAARNGNGLQLVGSATITKRLNVVDEHATIVLGSAWMAVSTGGATYNDIYSYNGMMEFLSDDGQTTHIGLMATTDRRFTIYRYATVLASTTNAFAYNQWYYLELKVTLSDTTGAVDLRVNGQSWLALTNVDTKNAGTKTVLDTVRLRGSLGVSGSSMRYDDLYVVNGAGTIRNNFLGDLAIETLLPNGNGTYSQLLGSDGNRVDNYLLVNESPPSETQYVGSAVDGEKDTYAMGNLTRTTGNILGVQTQMYATKSDTGAKSMRPVLRHGVTDAVGATKALNQTWEVHQEVFQQNPVTAADWTINDINNVEVGAEVQP